MRHNKKGNHLGRKSSHRKAMLANMAVSLIKHKRIKTTLAKAKALRTYVEPLLSKSKNDTTHSRRTVFAFLKDKAVVTELFRDVAVKIADRPGGYTRILKIGNRIGDNAEMCYIELVDYNTTYVSEPKETKQQAKRTRRGKKTADQAEPEVKSTSKKETKAETPESEVKPEILIDETTPEEPKAETNIEEENSETKE